jgi:tungstate transport system substrate-binding protein
MRRLATFLALALALTGACARSPRLIHLATTTTIDGSGLLAVLVAEFQKDSGLELQAVVGGSGRALDILDMGDVDLAFTHDPEAERAFFDRGEFAEYRKVMFNDFVIAGPTEDPAHVRAATSAVDAMTRIAASAEAFASRADSSGTHSRELSLWKAAGRKPEGPRLIETGQGMAPTLRIASERRAYVLTDRPTLTQIGPTLRLVVLNEGDPVLLNTYAVMYRRGLSGDRLDHARAFLTWLTDGRGRHVIEAFTIRGAKSFTVWPTDRPRSKPSDMPHAQ